MSTKVFVGNLSFSTVPEKLKEEFAVAGTVVDANIIARGPRSLGYGFVEMSTPEEAAKAVELINQTEIDGRHVNVEVARPREENQDSPQEGERRPRNNRRGPRRGRRPSGDDADNTEESGDASGGGYYRERRPRRVFRPRQETNNDDQGQEQEGDEGQYNGRIRRGRGYFNNNFSGGGGGGGRRGYNPRRSFRPRNNQQNDQVGEGQGEQQSQPRQFRPRRAPKPRQERVASSTTLFVANLPFAMDDQGLTDLFADLKVAKAHVVTKRNGRSKGFGFVEFANEEDQQAALKEIDGREVDGRVLNVKVALTAIAGSEAESANDQGSSSGAIQGEQAETTKEEAAAPAQSENSEAKEEAKKEGDQ